MKEKESREMKDSFFSKKLTHRSCGGGIEKQEVDDVIHNGLPRANESSNCYCS